MDNRSIEERFAWYLPNRLRLWREHKADEVDEVTRIVAMNHQEAILECEEVDLMFLLSCIDDESEELSVPDEQKQEVVETEVSEVPEEEAEETVDAAQLIDSFLSLTDFRITPPEEDDIEDDLDWELVNVESKFDAKEERASEELAEIYMKQGLYEEAKEIYGKLSLQYSEKSVYFAELTKRLSEKSPKKDLEKVVKRGEKGDKKRNK